MTHSELAEMLERHEFFDQAIIFHGYTDYMRDYEVVVYIAPSLALGKDSETRRYVFRYCVHADVESALPPSGWKKSLDERLIDHATGVDLDGYVWGVKWQCVYPGVSVIERSKEAAKWSKEVGIDFHEVRIETNGHNFRLIFAELEVLPADVGYSPFTVDPPDKPRPIEWSKSGDPGRLP